MRSGLPTPRAFPNAESQRPTILGRRWVVSAGHPLVAQVAATAFERGGNAIDAGVAAGLAANVVQADMCNLGGIAPIVVRPAGSAGAFSIAGVGTWGASATLEAYADRYGEEMPLGAACAVVPGAIGAWIAALREFGTWTFADAARSAIELAHDGVVVDHRLAASYEVTGRGFSRWESSRAIYWPEGRAPRVGERIVQHDLGSLLERLAAAEQGSREDGLRAVHAAFYAGDPAQLIARFCQEHGGWLTTADLEAFEAEVVPATTRMFGDWSIHVNPPWSQGPVLLQALGTLANFDLVGLGRGTADSHHVFAEAIKLAMWDRERYYGDPQGIETPLAMLLSDQYAVEQAARVQLAAALPYTPQRLPHGRARADTTYVATLDATGNAFSAMPSDTLDGGPVVPGLGIIVSPRGVQSRPWGGHPASLGPRRRPRITPAPAIALRSRPQGDADVMAFGCPGGDVIVQAMLQAFLNLVVHGQTPQQAVEEARVATFSFSSSFYPFVEAPGMLAVEGRIPDATRADLAARGHDVVAWPDYDFDMGGVSMVMDLERPTTGERVLAASADPRRSTYALGW